MTIVTIRTKTNVTQIRTGGHTAWKMNIDMHVTSVAKKCISAPSLNVTGSKVVKFNHCHNDSLKGILKNP